MKNPYLLLERTARHLEADGFEPIHNGVLDSQSSASRLLVALSKKQMGSLVIVGLARAGAVDDDRATLALFHDLVASHCRETESFLGIRGGVFGILGFLVADSSPERDDWLRSLKRRRIVENVHVVCCVLDTSSRRVLAHKGAPFGMRRIYRLLEAGL